MDKVYLPELERLRYEMEEAGDSVFMTFGKIITLVVLNMRYERIAFSRELPEHPYLLTRDLVRDAINQFAAWREIAFIQHPSHRLLQEAEAASLEERHRVLFDEIWNRYDEQSFENYIERYVRRIRLNNLEPLIRGKRCIDLGCGNGNFCFALVRCGAASVVGIDFSEHSIRYAESYMRRHNIQTAVFRCASVYETGLANNEFDFAIQNGVFHHLDDEDRALRETVRILKPGGWFWYYTDGEGGISYDLWDTSVAILRRVPPSFIERVLRTMEVSVPKMVHLMDGLHAVYKHTSWEKATALLARFGFSHFRRLTGGYDTDFDLDRIQADPYGREKFGEGDLRILCQLADKKPCAA